MIRWTEQHHFPAIPELLIIYLDRQWRIHFINQVAMRTLGYVDEKDIIGKSLREIMHEEDQYYWDRWLDEEPRMKQERIALQKKDGESISVFWHHETLAGDNYPAPLTLLIGREQNALQQSQESARMFRMVAADYLGSILIIDKQFNILYANPSAANATGYQVHELIGKPVGMIYGANESDRVLREVAQEVERQGLWKGEICYRRKDGETYKEVKKVTVTRDANGNIQYYFSIGEDLSLREHYQQQIGRLMMYDQLTGLMNRSGFLSEVRKALQHPDDGKRKIAVIHVDFDHFDSVSTLWGDAGVEHVVAETANRIREIVHPGITLSRVGSNEFLLLIDQDDAESQSVEMAEHLLETLREPYAHHGEVTALTASVGIACHLAAEMNAHQMVANALSAGRRAKAAGGNQWVQFEEAMAAAEIWRRELRQALERGEMVLHYQPQVSLFSGGIVGLEALLRWRHPVRGMVMPEDFIPVAEESNMIINLGEWVLDEACRQMREWMDAGLPPIKIAVNLAARHFRKPGLPSCIAQSMEKWRVDPRQIEIEITESTMMQDVDSAMRNIEQLKAQGLRISLDDFGTGYSSMAHLSRFSIDMVKIDKSFVRDITVNPVNAAIAQATIAMSHKLGKKVLAEGVETAEQMQYLRRSDCDEMQGQYFSMPLPPNEVAQLLREDVHMNVFGQTKLEGEHTVLIVDDEISILNSLKRTLRREGYNILLAPTVDEGFSLLAQHPVQLIISDQHMGDVAGTEFLSQVKSLYPNTIRMVLSAYSEIGTVTDAINKGSAYRFLTKPWSDEEIKEEIRGALRHWREHYGRV